MSVKHQAIPKLRAVGPNKAVTRTAVATRHPLLDLYDIMTWWERVSFAMVIASTIVCLILLVLMLNGQV